MDLRERIDRRSRLSGKKRIVIKVGTTTITYSETGALNLDKMERFVRILINLHNQGKEIVVVSSGAVGAGRSALGLKERPETVSEKQACAAVGQAKLMMIYEKLFNEYGQMTAQILLTKEAVTNKECRRNARQTFDELFRMNVIPIVNENDAISVDELAYGNFGDNDTLAAHVCQVVDADLLILMSDIDGFYTDDPKINPNAQLIHTVEEIDSTLAGMAKGVSGDFGTGGMTTKLRAADIVNRMGADLVIANGQNIYLIHDIMEGREVGTLFLAKKENKKMTKRYVVTQ